MAFSTNGGGGKLPPTLSEINVTPLVDVMLVLLIIFMVTAAVETVRVEQELEQVRVERELVPPKPEEPKNPLKDVPIVVPNTNVQKINESDFIVSNEYIERWRLRNFPEARYLAVLLPFSISS